LIQTNAARPDARAAELFPQAADANRNVFYRADGRPKTVREVYEWALQQPSGTDAVAARNINSQVAYNTTAPSTFPDNGALLSNVMNWTPHVSRFASSDDDSGPSLPVAPFLMTPGVMDLLSSVTPSSG
jgi:hypothetical protein